MSISCLKTLALNILQNCTPEAIASALPCGHIFHRTCLENSITNGIEICPARDCSKSFESELQDVEVSESESAPIINKDSVNFLELYNKITYAEENNQKTTQDVIRCYYNFGKGLTIWFDHYRQSNNEDASNALVNDKIREQTVDKITEVNLRKRKEKARKIYKLFNSVGVELIGRVRSFSASAISKLSLDDIDYIIAKTLKANRNLV
ncbi:17432_t:CDS:2 [Entrophospora sp. SA101]|nr:354_t:CDS:2 [Entrophospora sp. SA101]CAJ0759212.1 798_t:CDS:2 [Entrophospora sp. SA101]CAJ0760505.1 17432_t:CDS:2 [Entrophospora sp. SA101]